MKVVGLRELKNRLSEYVRQVRAGGRVLVTDRGEVVAELAPPGAPGARARTPLEAGLDHLAEQGLLSRAAPNDPTAYPSLPPILPAGVAQRLLDEERGSR